VDSFKGNSNSEMARMTKGRYNVLVGVVVVVVEESESEGEVEVILRPQAR